MPISNLFKIGNCYCHPVRRHRLKPKCQQRLQAIPFSRSGYNGVLKSSIDFTMVVVGYARVSSLEQADNTYALKQQINRLKNAGATQIVQDIESGRRPI